MRACPDGRSRPWRPPRAWRSYVSLPPPRAEAAPVVSLRLVAYGDGDSLDHFVRPAKYGLRDRQADRLGSLEVDDQLDLVEALHRQLRRVRAQEHPVHIRRRQPAYRVEVHAVPEEPSLVHAVPLVEHGGQLSRYRFFGNE